MLILFIFVCCTLLWSLRSVAFFSLDNLQIGGLHQCIDIAEGTAVLFHFAGLVLPCKVQKHNNPLSSGSKALFLNFSPVLFAEAKYLN